MSKHVVMFSGGVGSWMTARRVPEKPTLLFADTLMEDEDLYRFLDEAARDVGGDLVKVAEGRTPWEVFFDVRFLGNSRVDPCSRILKRQLLRKWLEDNCEPSFTTVYIGIDWTESHRFERAQGYWNPWRVKAPLCDPPYLTKRQILDELEDRGIKTPALYRLGFPHNNCFHPDTRFITDRGIKSFRDTVGCTVRVLGVNAGWKDATIRSFGQQELWRIDLERYGTKKTILTTASHRWFIRSGRTKRVERVTMGLRKGDRLYGIYGNLRSEVRPSAFGISHGIVYGDGTQSTQPSSPAHVQLCGHKNVELLRYFPNSPTTELAGGDVIVRDLPRLWKTTPSLDESTSYLYGWLAGYMAADGTVTGGQVSISSADEVSLQFVRDIAPRLGITANPITSYERVGLGSEPTTLYTVALHPGLLREDFFIRPDHLAAFMAMGPRKRPGEWVVVGVSATQQTSEVMCAVVPDGHAFTLEDHIFTGNCGGFCIKAGQAHFALLLRTMPDRYAYHEAKEQEICKYLGKKVTILRDRTGGETTPLSLMDFRERICGGGQYDMYEWGGCACFTPGEYAA